MPASALQPVEILLHVIAADIFLVGLDQLGGDRPRYRAGGRLVAVDAAHAADAEAGRGQEYLVGGIGVVQIDILLGEGDLELGGEIDRRLAADPGQDVALLRRAQPAVADDEDVAAEPFAKITV